jgi:hypothetical protein
LRQLLIVGVVCLSAACGGSSGPTAPTAPPPPPPPVIANFAGNWQGVTRIVSCEHIAIGGFTTNNACTDTPGEASKLQLTLTQNGSQVFGLMTFGQELKNQGSVTGSVDNGTLTLRQENNLWVRSEVNPPLTVPTTIKVSLESFSATLAGSQLNAEYVVWMRADTPRDPVARYVASFAEYKVTYRTEIVVR